MNGRISLAMKLTSKKLQTNKKKNLKKCGTCVCKNYVRVRLRENYEKMALKYFDLPGKGKVLTAAER